MTPEQFTRLLDVLEQLATMKQYTLTGAADWPILVVVGGLLIAAVGAMWADLRNSIREGRCEWKQDLERHSEENRRSFDTVWRAHRECQEDCCNKNRKEQ